MKQDIQENNPKNDVRKKSIYFVLIKIMNHYKKTYTHLILLYIYLPKKDRRRKQNVRSQLLGIVASRVIAIRK